MKDAVWFYWTGEGFDYSDLLAIASASYHAPYAVNVMVDERPHDNPHWDRLATLSGVQVQEFDPAKALPPDLFDRYQRVKFHANRSDVVRFWLLAEHGGLYLDTDTLTVAELIDTPERLVVRDRAGLTQTCPVGLPAEDPLATDMLEEFAKIPELETRYEWHVNLWGDVVERGQVDFADTAEYAPVPWTEWESIFTPCGTDVDLRRVRILHHFGYFSSKYTAGMDKDWLGAHPCLFSTLAAPVAERLG